MVKGRTAYGRLIDGSRVKLWGRVGSIPGGQLEALRLSCLVMSLAGPKITSAALERAAVAI